MQAGIAAAGHALAPGDIVLIHTGRDAFIKERDFMFRGPGVTADATRWLFEQGVRVMGIDAWGWDAPLDVQAKEAIERDEQGIFWAAHQCDLPYSQIERLTNLAALPSTGFQVACFPLKIQRASAAPARVVAILPGETTVIENDRGDVLLVGSLPFETVRGGHPRGGRTPRRPSAGVRRR